LRAWSDACQALTLALLKPTAAPAEPHVIGDETLFRTSALSSYESAAFAAKPNRSFKALLLGNIGSHVDITSVSNTDQLKSRTREAQRRS
jgi:hypothetical protein